ncbi:MAG: outer membrane lipoprotein carrier protein LolA [Treponema sp.]|nr:outer membrane lipoprotein carrier protein LolA [Treponema sp.]
MTFTSNSCRPAAALCKSSAVLMFVALLAIMPLCAQTPSLDSVCTGLTAHEVTVGSFVQLRTAPGLKRPLKSSGTFVICGEGIAWKTAIPFASLLAISNGKIIQAGPDGKKNVLEASVTQPLAVLFTGDKDALEKSFSIAFSSQGQGWKMLLTPKDSSIASAIKTVTLEGDEGMDKRETFIDSVTIEETGGGKIQYTLSGQSHKNALNDDEKANFSAQ